MKRLSEKRRVILGGLAGSLLLGTLGLYAAEKSDYKVGDRLPPKPAAGASGYKELTWDALMPADWNPAKDFQALDLANMSDSDPRAVKALEQLRAALDNAPVVADLNGQRIRIAGFTVPLESARGQISEFLLVPYFGACIHTPPPPANQIIHVKPVKPYKSDQAIEAVWVSGAVETVRSETGLGSAGYRMRAEAITPYTR
jgi:uncharacterized protein